MTLSLTDSSRFKQLRQSFDVMIIDEAGQAFESETVIPMVSSFRRSALRRLHVVMLGDHKQLSAVSRGMFLAKNARLFSSRKYRDMCKSLFERLFRVRVPSIMLNRQYRMHPTIADIILPVFYGMQFTNAVVRKTFKAPYTDTSVTEGGYAAISIVDTSSSALSFETCDASGGIFNSLEIDIVRHTLCRLGAFGTSVMGRMCVMSPYNLQISKMKDELDNVDPEWRNMRRLRVELSTVDSMQGGRGHRHL